MVNKDVIIIKARPRFLMGDEAPKYRTARYEGPKQPESVWGSAGSRMFLAFWLFQTASRV